MDERPAPLISPEVDIRGMRGFMMDAERLLSSELVALATPEEGWHAFMLWCRAWQQHPAGSLPNDERVLAAFSRAGPRWKKVREMAMRGFILCSDDRYYHRVLCEQVMTAWGRRKAYQSDQDRLKDWRKKRRGNGNETAPETVFETDLKPVSPPPVKRVDRDSDRDKVKERENLSLVERSASDDLLASAASPRELFIQAVSVWNAICGLLLGKVAKVTDARRQVLRKRLVEDFGGDIEAWRAFCTRVASAPFLTGTNDRDWRADFDWCLKAANLTKIMEGRYDPRNGASVPKPKLDMRYFNRPPAEVLALPKPSMSAPEWAGWCEAGFGRWCSPPEEAAA